MFSSYAIENSSDLEEQLDKLIEFYPGCNGGYTVSISTYETSAYSGKEYIIYPQYTITNDDFEYRIRVTAYVKNEEESDKIGLYSIQVMTKEAMPDGFKWREEDSDPGIYVLE